LPTPVLRVAGAGKRRPYETAAPLLAFLLVAMTLRREALRQTLD